MNFLWWALLGLIAGGLAKFLMPGKQSGGCIITMILGLIGAIVGGWVGTLLNIGTVDDFSIGSIALATLGALIVLFIYGLLTRKNT